MIKYNLIEKNKYFLRYTWDKNISWNIKALYDFIKWYEVNCCKIVLYITCNNNIFIKLY